MVKIQEETKVEVKVVKRTRIIFGDTMRGTAHMVHLVFLNTNVQYAIDMAMGHTIVGKLIVSVANTDGEIEIRMRETGEIKTCIRARCHDTGMITIRVEDKE